MQLNTSPFYNPWSTEANGEPNNDMIGKQLEALTQTANYHFGARNSFKRGSPRLVVNTCTFPEDERGCFLFVPEKFAARFAPLIPTWYVATPASLT